MPGADRAEHRRVTLHDDVPHAVAARPREKPVQPAELAARDGDVDAVVARAEDVDGDEEGVGDAHRVGGVLERGAHRPHAVAVTTGLGAGECVSPRLLERGHGGELERARRPGVVAELVVADGGQGPKASLLEPVRPGGVVEITGVGDRGELLGTRPHRAEDAGRRIGVEPPVALDEVAGNEHRGGLLGLHLVEHDIKGAGPRRVDAGGITGVPALSRTQPGVTDVGVQEVGHRHEREERLLTGLHDRRGPRPGTAATETGSMSAGVITSQAVRPSTAASPEASQTVAGSRRSPRVKLMLNDSTAAQPEPPT